MQDYEYIAIEGCIGAGKTALAQLLAERNNARAVLERFEDNPFLPKFYEDKERYAFQTQLAFLANRFKQQKSLLRQDLFHEFTITDYTFDKDRIFARVNLEGDEFWLYESIYEAMSGISPQPDLVIYIKQTTDRLMDNIHWRGREYEQDISRDYIDELNHQYNQFFSHYNKTPLMTINATQIDFVNKENHLHYIEEQIFTQPIHDYTYLDIVPE